jgi:predicted ATPase
MIRHATASAVTPAPPAQVRGSLPVYLASFVGREAELDVVAALLGATRLVTLTGPAGVGKTRLAVGVAAALQGRYRDGASFVPLAPVADAGLVVQTIAQALDLPPAAGRPVAELLRSHLRSRELLLVLDNLEHVLPAAAEVAALLAACPNVRVLATSRARLKVYGEHEVAVSPLPAPDPARPPSAARLGDFPASRLFLDRARAASSGFALGEADAPAVAAICAHLDGLPLAIELAAARVRLFPPRALAARLEQRLAVLTGGPRDQSARQRTLRARSRGATTCSRRRSRSSFARLASSPAAARSRRPRRSAASPRSPPRQTRGWREGWLCSTGSKRWSSTACWSAPSSRTASRASRCSRRCGSSPSTS